MKVLKWVIIGILALIAIPLIAAIFIPKEFDYEKSVQINAPVDSVWEHVNSLAGIDSWSPWNDYDPQMKKEWSGTDGTVGATQKWESDSENVGHGEQTIANIEAPHLIETDIHFISPFDSKAKSFVKLDEVNGGTRASWGFESEMPYPMNLMLVMMDMDAAMDKDFGTGLNKLKKLCEQ